MAPPPRFFACYVLTPALAPKRLRCTYVGFTVAPARRLRQHNGELSSGAWRTRKHRPWDMVAVVHGFPSKTLALQFEYAWQHPYRCRFSKLRLSQLRGRKGVGAPRSLKRKLVELHELLHVPPWRDLPLALSYTAAFAHDLARASGFYAWPPQMRCETRALVDFVAICRAARAAGAATADDDDDDDDDAADERSVVCFVCEDDLAQRDASTLFRCYHASCGMRCHSRCLADHFLTSLSDDDDDQVGGRGDENAADTEELRPERGRCPECQGELLWTMLLEHQSNSEAPVALTQHTPSKRRRAASSSDRQSQTSDQVTPDDHELCCRDSSDDHEGVEPPSISTAVVIDLTLDDE